MGGAIYARSNLTLYTYAHMPSSDQNWVSNESLDLQLSKDIKNSLLSWVVLPIEVAEEAKVIDKKFPRQKIKNF